MDPTTEQKPAAPAQPMLRDPLLGLEIPTYAGGDPLPTMPEGDRGDLVPGSQAPVPQGTVATAVAEQTAEKPADEADKPTTPPRGPDGKFVAAKPAEPEVTEPVVTGDPETKGQVTKPEGDDEPRIPKSRLDKEIERRKAAEAKLAQQQAAEQAQQQAAQNQYDFDAAEEEYMNLLLDGKLAEAKAKRSEIRKAERAEFESVAAQKATQVTSADKVTAELTKVAAEYEAQYPQLNVESDQFDETALVHVKAIYGAYLSEGLYASPVEAFSAAIKATVAANGWKPLAPAAAAAPAAAPAAAAPARTAQKRVEAIAAQPASLAQAGQSSAAQGAHDIDVNALSEAEIAKLPLATLKRLRGDEL